MLSTLTTNWHAMRLLRLGLGGIAIVEYFSTPQPLLLLIGGVFIVQGLFNWGCYGAGACEWKGGKNGSK